MQTRTYLNEEKLHSTVEKAEIDFRLNAHALHKEALAAIGATNQVKLIEDEMLALILEREKGLRPLNEKEKWAITLYLKGGSSVPLSKYAKQGPIITMEAAVSVRQFDEMLQEVFDKNPGRYSVLYMDRDPFIFWDIGSNRFFVASFAEKVTSLAEIVEKTKAEVPKPSSAREPLGAPEAFFYLVVPVCALPIIVVLFRVIRAALGW